MDLKDTRADAARYYDLNPRTPDDLTFYRSRILSPRTTILELGCGTGRVLVPLTQDCTYIHGVDLSPGMIAICREKLRHQKIPEQQASIQIGNIIDLDLGRTFDLITAPFRVFQNLENDAQVDGFFETVRKHLAPTGRCILSAFNPNRDKEGLRAAWSNQEEYHCWETTDGEDRIVCVGRNARIHPDKLILYPDLIYRRFRGEELVDEVVLNFPMRAYYPDEFEQLVQDQGFVVTGKWGGYNAEAYGDGPELVIEFRL